MSYDYRPKSKKGYYITAIAISMLLIIAAINIIPNIIKNINYPYVSSGFQDEISASYYPAQVTCTVNNIIGFENNTMKESISINQTLTSIPGVDFETSNLLQVDDQILTIESDIEELTGHYKGVHTYDNESIIDDYTPKYTMPCAYMEYEIIDEIDSHKNVLKFTDKVNPSSPNIVYEIPDDELEYIEFYMGVSSLTGSGVATIIYGSTLSDRVTIIYFSNNLHYYYYTTGYTTVDLGLYTIDTFYKFVINVDWVSLNFDLIIDDITVAENKDFCLGSPTEIGGFLLGGNSATIGSIYFDSVSWNDTNYIQSDFEDYQTSNQINQSLYCEFSSELTSEMNFESLHQVNISINADSNITSTENIEFQVLNNYTSLFEKLFDINDSTSQTMDFNQSIYENFYTNNSIGLEFKLVGAVMNNQYAVYLDMINITVSFYKNIETTSIQSKTIDEVEIYFNNILLLDYEFSFEINRLFEFNITTTQFCYFELNITVKTGY